MSNGGLAGIGARAANFQVAASVANSEKTKKTESEKTSEAVNPSPSSESSRASQITGKTLNVAA